MQPYVIRQGDHLPALAHQFGFDAETVWNDPANADLRTLRPNSNILFAGDLLRIPDPPQGTAAGVSLTPGSTNTFVSRAPTITVSVTFVGVDSSTYASKAYTVQELDQLTGLSTDGSGMATFAAPVTLQEATLLFTDTGESWALSIGALDPVNTLSGIFQRLQHLGYIAANVDFDPTDLEHLRVGLLSLKASQNGDDAPPSSSPPSSSPPSGPQIDLSPPPPSSPSSDPSAGPASTGPSSAPASNPTSSPPASAPPESEPPASAPPVSAPASSPPSAPASGPGAANDDNAGLADDGTLDPGVASLLVTVHGC